jgi:hypothetical protein
MSSSPRRAWKRRRLASIVDKKMERRLAHENFMLRIRKEREIGVHPKYLNAYARPAYPSSARQWEAASREWDKRHSA